MTLLELLCQELPKRDGDFCADELASDHATAIVTHEQYEATGRDDLVEIVIENYGDDARPKFRPLRTEAERTIDEMVRLSGVSIGAAKILYDAGYRK